MFLSLRSRLWRTLKRKRCAYARHEALSSLRATLKHYREYERICAAQGVPIEKVDPSSLPHPALLPGETWANALRSAKADTPMRAQTA